MTQITASILDTATATATTCSCAEPIPAQHAKRKGAAVTICRRCGLRVPLRLR